MQIQHDGHHIMNLFLIESSQKLQKRFDNLNKLESHIYLQTKISLSNESKISNPLENGNNVTSDVLPSSLLDARGI
jgi:hypothetical protein